MDQYSIQQQQIQQSIFASLTLDNILDDLAARFIVNLPEEELESMDRVCFQIEQAHWYYEDFVRPTAVNLSLLPSMSLKKFSLLMFQSCPLLHDLLPTYKEIWDSFMAYKERVPVCGAVLISEYWDKVLLVKGWNKGASWSFPRGKINKEEADGMCAIREVLEETGFDLSDRFPTNQLEPDYKEREGTERKPYYIEVVIKEQKIRLYFIHDVKEDTHFETRTRKEISKIDWFKLSDLPTWGKNKKAAKEGASSKQPKFYMVTPFISHLKLWIDRNKPKDLKKRTSNQSSHKHSTPSSSHLSSRQQPPHFEDTDNDQVPDNHFNRSFSPSPDSTEETAAGDGDDENENFGPTTSPFATTDEGTLALSAFFFGGAPTVPVTLPVLVVGKSNHRGQVLDDVVTKTPPQLLASYERQTSLVQPRPKATSRHTSNLLALLREPNPIVSPKPKVEQKTKSLEGKNLLSTLDHLFAKGNSSTSPSQFKSCNTPPPIDLGDSTETETEEERNELDRKEKHNALLRALYTAVTKTPPPPPPPPSSLPTTISMSKQQSISSESGARRVVSPTFSAKEEWDRLQQNHQASQNLQQVALEAVRVEVLPAPKAKSGINLLSILNGRRESPSPIVIINNQAQPPPQHSSLPPPPQPSYYSKDAQSSFPLQQQQQRLPPQLQNHSVQPLQIPFYPPFQQQQQQQQPFIQQQSFNPQQFNTFPQQQQFPQQVIFPPQQQQLLHQSQLPFPPQLPFPIQSNHNLAYPNFPPQNQQSQQIPHSQQPQRSFLSNPSTNQQLPQQLSSSIQSTLPIRTVNNQVTSTTQTRGTSSTFAPFSPLPQAQNQTQPIQAPANQVKESEEDRLEGFPPLASPVLPPAQKTVGVRQTQLLSLFNAKVVI